MSSGWLSRNRYLIRMSYDNVIMSSGWHRLPFLSHPDEIVNFDFPHHAVALQRFRISVMAIDHGFLLGSQWTECMGHQMAKSQGRNFGLWFYRIVLKLDRWLGTKAAEAHVKFWPIRPLRKHVFYNTMTSSNGNIFRVTGHLCGEFTGHRWIPRTKGSDAELWCFLWSAHGWTVE